MRQRAAPPLVGSSGEGNRLTQRRQIGREPSSSWEITIKEATTSEDDSDLYHETTPPRSGNFKNYQNGGDQPLSVEHVQNKVARDKTARLQNFHTVFRTPHHVPDNKYKLFVQGQSTRRKKPSLNHDSLAQTCSGFSFIGVLFLVFAGILIDRQPLYLRGVLPAQVVQDNENGKFVMQVLLNSQQRLPAARVAYQAALIYALTMLACIYYSHRGWIQSQLYRRKNRYQDIPDLNNNNSTTIDAATTLSLHDNDTDVRSSPSRSDAYQQGRWSQATAAIRQWMAVRGWYYRPVQRLRRKTIPKTV